MTTPEQRVIEATAAAARMRRVREASRRVWRLAPAVAGAALAAALFVRWRGAPARWSLAVPLAAGIALMLYALVMRRQPRVSDSLASEIDRDAQLGGELRSAAWFAGRGSDEPWVSFHIARAAERVASVEFAAVYPPVRAARARITTALLTVAAVAILASVPRHSLVRASGVTGPAGKAGTTTALAVPPDAVPQDLPKELEALLAAIENGTLAAQLAAGNPAMQAALSKLAAINDPAALAALAKALAERANDPNAMKMLAERLKRDAALTPQQDVKNALEDLASKLSQSDHEKDSAGFESTDETQAGDSASLSTATSESTRDANAISGLGMLTMSNEEMAGADAPPGVGVGGGSSKTTGKGTMPEIANALRQETIEANEDDVTGGMHTDARRKTERGSASAVYTRGAASAFENGRATVPPTVPEKRRAGMQTYFSRKQ
jgi:hypothetical protein